LESLTAFGLQDKIALPTDCAVESALQLSCPTYGGYSVFELANDGKVVPALTVPFGNNVSTDNRGRSGSSSPRFVL
jgi:hypothetical protein